MPERVVTKPQASDTADLLEMLNGYRQTCLIVSAVQTGLIEELRETALSSEELANRLGAHPQSLRRFLRALELLGLVQCRDGTTALTLRGRQFIRGASGLRDRAILTGQEYLPAWANLQHSLLTGETAFDDVFGMDVWRHREQQPQLNECFNRLMTEDQTQTERSILQAYDFSDAGVVVDVGGGHGRLIADILATHPQLRGILFDQPGVVQDARAVLSTAGVAERCRTIAGSFFDSVPAGGDTYLLQHILHDWNDERCVKILRNCRAAMDHSDTLLVVENLLPEAGDAPARMIMLDLHMMVMLGGRERAESEFDALLQASGLLSTNCLPTRGNTCIIVAKPS